MLRTLFHFCHLLIGVVQSLCNSLRFPYYKQGKKGGGGGKTIFFSCPNEHMLGSTYCVKPEHSGCALLCMSFFRVSLCLLYSAVIFHLINLFIKVSVLVISMNSSSDIHRSSKTLLACYSKSHTLSREAKMKVQIIHRISLQDSTKVHAFQPQPEHLSVKLVLSCIPTIVAALWSENGLLRQVS